MLSIIAGGIWRNVVSGGLAEFLPFLAVRRRMRECPVRYKHLAAKYPLGDPIRAGVIQGEWELPRLVVIISLISTAYSETMKTSMTIVVTLFAVFPPVFTLFLPD